MTNPAEAAATAFIARWSPSGGAELANSQSFLRDLCDLLDVPHPDPKVASDHPDDNAYVFERDVLFKHGDGTTSGGRIDLYKRGCFVLESKQGSANPADLAAPSVPLAAPARQKRGTAVRGTPAWSQAMDRAYGQAAHTQPCVASSSASCRGRTGSGRVCLLRLATSRQPAAGRPGTCFTSTRRAGTFRRVFS